MTRRILNTFLVIAIAFSLLLSSGCDINNDISMEATKAPVISSDTVEEVTIGLLGLYEPQNEASIFVSDYIKDRFKIEIKPVPLSNENYQTEIDWMVSANMLPDVFTHEVIDNKLQYKVLITAGLIQSIPKNIWAQYERLSAVMSWYEKVYAYNGEMYFLPRTYQTFDQTHGSSNVILYRSDWAQELSQSTFGDTAGFNDIITLLGAYRSSDPDNNSIWDTWGITGSGGLEFIRDSFLIPFGVDDWVKEDDKWIPGVISLQAKEAISWAAQLYREGIIDPEIDTQTSDEALLKFATGKSGALLTSAYYKDLEKIEQTWKSYNPDKGISTHVKIIPSYATPLGTINNGIETFDSGSMISSKVGEGKLNKIVALFDFMLSNEGRNLLEYGNTDASSNNQASGSFLELSPEFISFTNLASWNMDKNPSSSMVDSEFMIYSKDMIEKNIWPWSFEEEHFTRGMITPEMCILDINRIAQDKILHLIKTTRDFEADWEIYVESMYNEINLSEAIIEVNAEAIEYFGESKAN